MYQYARLITLLTRNPLKSKRTQGLLVREIENSVFGGQIKLRKCHKMFKFIFSFGLGIYTGIYISQNYNVPRVDEPSALWGKLKDFADKHKKD